MKYKKILILMILIIFSCSKKEKDQLLFSKTFKGDFYEKISSSGYLEAVNSIDIKAPMFDRSFTSIYLIPEGSFVIKGDLVAKLDSGNYQEKLENIEEKIESALEDLENYYVECNDNLISLSNSLEEKMIALQIEFANQATLKFAPEVDQRKGQINLNQRQNAVSNQVSTIKRSIHNQKKTIKSKEQNIKKLYEEKTEIIEHIKDCDIYAPRKGLIVYKTSHPWTREKIKLGDELRRGHAFLAIPDLEKMMVKLEINEVDINRLYKNMLCKIVLDAYPDQEYTGNISYISALAHGKSNNKEIMVFDVEVIINETDIDILKPGMTSKVDIIISEYKNANYIPLDAIFQVAGENGKIYLLENKKIKPANVLLGPKNDDFIIIKSSLPKNVKLILYNQDIEGNDFNINNYKFEELKIEANETIESITNNEIQKYNIKSNEQKTNQDINKSKREFSLSKLKTENPQMYEKITAYLKKNKLTEKDIKNDRNKMRKMFEELDMRKPNQK